MKRNLIYHVCPLRDNDLWERNVEQLLRRIEIFDGTINIAVSVDARTHDVEEVRRRFRGRGLDVNWLRAKNDKRLREVATFLPLLERVAGRRGEATFYAHTKGNSTAQSVQGSVYWRNTMYHKLLDGWERCVELLGEYAAVGCNKIIWKKDQRCPYPSGLGHGNWMFAGTFFWFCNDAVFSKNWQHVPRDRYGAEAWLSGMFGPEEAKSVFQPWPESRYPAPDPYNPELYARNGMAIEDVELEHPAYTI